MAKAPEPGDDGDDERDAAGASADAGSASAASADAAPTPGAPAPAAPAAPPPPGPAGAKPTRGGRGAGGGRAGGRDRQAAPEAAPAPAGRDAPSTAAGDRSRGRAAGQDSDETRDSGDGPDSQDSADSRDGADPSRSDARGGAGAPGEAASASAAPLAPASPLAWAVEVVIGAALYAVVERLFFPGGRGLLDTAPHPLTGLAAIVAVRHGTPRGLYAGLLAAAIHAAFELAGARGGAAPLLGPPLLTLLAGAGLGELARGRAVAVERLRARLKALGGRARAAEAGLTELSERYDALERRLLEPAASVALLHRAAARLETLDEGAVYPALLELLRDQLRLEACEAYVLEGGELRLRAAIGPEAAPEVMDPRGGLCGLAIERRGLASARDVLDHPELAAAREDTAIAAPLLGQAGQVLALVNVRSLPFTRLTSASERILEMACDWAARAVERSRLVERLRTVDEGTGTLTYAHLCERLAEELRRARRFEAPLCLLVLAVDDPDKVPEPKKLPLRRSLAQLLRGTLRTIDLVATWREPLGFAVALTQTPVEGAREVARRLGAELGRLALRPYADAAPLRARLGVALLEPAMHAPADLELAATRALQSAESWAAEASPGGAAAAAAAATAAAAAAAISPSPAGTPAGAPAAPARGPRP